MAHHWFVIQMASALLASHAAIQITIFYLASRIPTDCAVLSAPTSAVSNPRDSFNPGAAQQLWITNRHRILKVGRRYDPQKDLPKPGLVFMCLNADIERQFEFVQQTWIQASSFQGLQNEINPIAGHGTASHFLTIPTPGGPLRVGHVSF